MDVPEELQNLYNEMDRWESIARMNSLSKIADKIREWRLKLREVIEALQVPA